MALLTLQNQRRPSAWLLGPALVAFVLFGMGHRDLFWSVLCVVGVLSSYVTGLYVKWPRWRDGFRVLLVLGAGYAIGYFYFLVVMNEAAALPFIPRFWFGPWFYVPTAITASLLLVWLWHVPFYPKGRSWAVYGLSGWIVLCSGQFLHPSALFVSILMFYCITLLLAMLLAGLSHEAHGQLWGPRRRQLLFFLFWSALVGLGTWSAIRGLHVLDQNMARLIGEILRVPAYSGQLGANRSMQLRRRQQIRLSPVLVATMAREGQGKGRGRPGYMRTRVLTRYVHGRWLTPPSLMPFLKGHRRKEGLRFQLAAPASASTKYVIKPFLTLGGPVLLGYGTTHIDTRFGVSCKRTSARTLDCGPAHWMNSYHLSRRKQKRLPFGTGEATFSVRPKLAHSRKRSRRRKMPAGLRRYLMALKKRRDARRKREQKSLKEVLDLLRPLALKVTGADKDKPLRAAQALQSYFRRHYTYSLSVRLALKGDPTVDFVLNKRPAYCQYFASGMVLMMRALGHKARVASGFVTKEYNVYTKQWLIRQRDAHAWTEVFDPTNARWVAFDATPPANLAPMKSHPLFGAFEQVRTWMGVRWREFISSMREFRLQEWLSEFGAEWAEFLLKPTTWAWVIGLILLWWSLRNRLWLLALLRQLWELLERRDAVKEGVSVSQVPLHLQVKLTLQQLLDAWGASVSPIRAEETIEAYLLRLETLTSKSQLPAPSTSEWKRLLTLYNDLRFCPTPPGDPEPLLEELKELAQGLLPEVSSEHKTPSM